MRVPLHEGYLTLAGAVIGIVALWCYYPVPAELFKVDCEWVTATARLRAVFWADVAAAFGALFALIPREDVEVWTLLMIKRNCD